MHRNSSLDDTERIKFLNTSIGSVLDAVRNGSNARGYFVWSFMDTFDLLGDWEWTFGLYYVNLDDKDLKRYPKHSANWYSAFLKGRSSGGDTNILQLSNSNTVVTQPLSAQ